MRHTWAVGAGVSVLVMALTACGGGPAAPTVAPSSPVSGEPATNEPVPEVPAAQASPITSIDGDITSVRLETGSSSAVITASGHPAVTVDRAVYFDGPEPAPSHRIEGTTLVLTGCELPNCYFEYHVVVPAGVSVQGEAGSGRVTATGAAEAKVRSGSGSVKLTDIAGPVDVASDSGPVSLSAVHGDVLVATASGPITGDALGGSTTTVASGSGPVRLAFATAQTVRATTASGPIHIAVPTGRYHVSAQAIPEYTDVEIADDPTAPTVISARSVSGPVTVTSTSR